jgi:hypothetical protein
MRLAHVASEALEERANVSSYRQIVNFEYWRTRAKMEQSPAALLARQKIYEAEQAYRRKSDLVSAKRLYEEGFQQWRIALDEFPLMKEAGTLPEELVDITVDYKEVFDLSSNDPDLTFPQDFILRDVIETRDQEDKLRGFFHTPPVRRPSGAPQPSATLPSEGRPPEPKEELAPEPSSEPKKPAATPTPQPPRSLPAEGRPPEPKEEIEAATQPDPPKT